ncbi:MAG TPA: D-glucuronyl C5-epimerase family protein [Terriglobales bacterium]|jgi:hypothetical protein
MSLGGRLHYYRRILQAYLQPGTSQLTFWHETPEVNSNAFLAQLGEYYMPFAAKANYAAALDSEGVPLLDYKGEIGLQHNPIAIAQWGLGNLNVYLRTRNSENEKKYRRAAQWLVNNLEQNTFGLWVWNHHFDWEYRTPLQKPWYSGLAQGQGISLLVRAYKETGDRRFLAAAEVAFEPLLRPISSGGVLFTDLYGDLWVEEYIVSPPTHILNGFIWAIWGVHDYFLATEDLNAGELFERTVKTLAKNLEKYDLGFWSLYEQSGTRLPMVASPFYHRLHIVQLRVMQRLTGQQVFGQVADRWEAYAKDRGKRTRALCYKSAFKLCYY